MIVWIFQSIKKFQIFNGPTLFRLQFGHKLDKEKKSLDNLFWEQPVIKITGGEAGIFI